MFAKIFNTVKYSLVAVNFLFLITGIIILSVGISVQRAYNGYHAFLTERFLSLPAFCIATGVIIFIIAFAGFYGAYTEHFILIMAYAGSMVVMFIFIMSACIAGYVLKGNTANVVQKKLLETLNMYGDEGNFVVTKLWDEVQEDFSCCGAINASDWLAPLNTSDTGGLPISCCEFPHGAVHTFNCTITMSTAFTNGCAASFGGWVQSHIGGIGLAGIFLIIMQAIAVGAAVWLAKMSREEQGAYP